MEINEIEIEAPWGKIAVKLWGNSQDTPVIVVHGLMDNAGSFDRLIPLLPKFYYICVDLPGHGRSSHFPEHIPIYTPFFLIVYSIVMQYFKHEKYIVLGHSYGGQLGLIYARIYPEKVEKLILLDTIIPFTVPVNNFKSYMADRVDWFLKMEKRFKEREPPQYTYEEVLNRVVKGRPFPLSEEAAGVLLKRALIPLENGKYRLSTDQRMKVVMTLPYDNRYAIQTFEVAPVVCPLLIIFGTENEIQRAYYRPLINRLKKQKNVVIKYVEGHHDVHQVSPENVAPHINKFLLSVKSKL